MLPLLAALCLTASDVPTVTQAPHESSRPLVALRVMGIFPAGGGLTIGIRPLENLEFEGALATWIVWSRASLDVGFVFDVNQRPHREDWGFVFSLVPSLGAFVDLIPTAAPGLFYGPRAKLKLELTHFSRGTPGLSLALWGGATFALNAPQSMTVVPEFAFSLGWSW